MEATEPRSEQEGAAQAAAPEDPRALDYLYKEADRVYYGLARRCGLSTCAYWMVYDIDRRGGEVALRELTELWSYSKQTINSAIKTLEAKGLITLEYVEGSRKNKVAILTPEGRAFTERYIRPGQEAERRAFCTLSPQDRKALLDLARTYTQALTEEVGRIESELDDGDKAAAHDDAAQEGTRA